MNIARLRALRSGGALGFRLTVHAKVESRKDGLTQDDLGLAFESGEVIEDYGDRVLVLAWAAEGNVPFHSVFEYMPERDEVVVVSAYVPDAALWRSDWKTRRARRKR